MTASFSEREAISEPGRKSCRQDFILSFGQVIPKPAQSDRALFFIKHHVSGSPVSISWLADAACVYEVPLARFQDQLIEWQPDNRTVLNVSSGSVGMTKKAEVRCLFGKTGGRVQLIQDITPRPWILQRGMDNCESFILGDKWEATQPKPFGRSQLITRPLDSDFGERVEAFEGTIGRSVIIMVPFHNRTF